MTSGMLPREKATTGVPQAMASTTAVVEAMACGTPVVAFSRGSMPEVITSGETGFLVGTVEEAVEALYRVPGLERAACRRRVQEHFSVERMVSDYLDVYRRIVRPEMEDTS